jgi:hypothetical protein
MNPIKEGPMNPKRWLGRGLLVFLALAPCGVRAQSQVKKLTAIEAKDHLGEQATVCGKVASARYAATTRGRPTFLNLDKPYPNQIFTVLIWGENREKFGTPQETYRDKQICVTGKISEYRGAPEIVIADPQSIELQK